jgi:hypothetical protein
MRDTTDERSLQPFVVHGMIVAVRFRVHSGIAVRACHVTPARANCTTLNSPRNPVLFREGIEAARNEFDD